jgi:hypothetical protein
MSRHDPLRQRVAQEAARLMVEQGIRDFSLAKRKAAERVGATLRQQLPENGEIEEALAEYLRIFYPESQPQRLRHLRETALRAMKLLERFEPRLVGPTLKGTVDQHSPVNLHLFALQPEEVSWFLLEQRIPHDTAERRYPGKPQQHYPLFSFMAGDVQVELTVFPIDGLRQAPKSPVDGRPIKRASLESVRRLLESD